MSKEFFKATNHETGEEKLIFITQSTAIRVKRTVGKKLAYDTFDRIVANCFYASNPVEAAGMSAEAFDVALLEWLDEWTVNVNQTFGADGTEVKDDPDPL